MNSNRHTLRTAFTLIELMVSIFLLLLIMVGVNTVFKTTSETIGAGQAQSAIIRDSRAIQHVFNQDFSNIAADGASIILRSQQIYQYSSLPDSLSDVDGAPKTADLTSSGTETTLNYPFYNFRSHRIDEISFFTRKLQRRQTGNDGVYMANQASFEQWVWLGHLRVPDNTAVTPVFFNPGDGTAQTNPNNFYANQWKLGRMAMELVEPIGATSALPGTIYDSAGVSQDFIYRTPSPSSTTLSPLDTNSNSTQVAHVGAYLLQESRYDLAGTSIAGFATILGTWQPANTDATSPPFYRGNFWTQMMAGPTSRFQCVPFPVRPLTSESTAKLAPILASGVSNFTVEYAGDFVKQDPTTGTVLDCYYDPATGLAKVGGNDGEVDYYVTGAGVNAVKSIRWYGLPRSTTNKTTVTALNGDVAPLRDTVRQCTAGGYGASQAPFECIKPATTTNPSGNNILSAAVSPDYGTGSANGTFYICAWGPTDTVRPKMYRITMTMEDPNGRLQNGQTFEYVYSTP